MWRLLPVDIQRNSGALSYEEIAPSIPLKSYINCFWMIRSPHGAEIVDRTFPDGCQEIVFNMDTQVQRNDGQGFFTNPDVELVGQMTRPYDIVTRGKQIFFGIKFFPHSFSTFTHESIFHLKDQSINVRDLLGSAFVRAIDQVYQKPEFGGFVRAMESFFIKRIADMALARSYLLVDRVVQQLFVQQGAISIDALAKRQGISDRYLQQAFKRHTGLTPGQLWKMIRFQRSLQYLSNGRESITDIAYKCGYYDHAHFTHDFKTLAGITPSCYNSTQFPLNHFFLAPGTRSYLCNYPLTLVDTL
jgi:AraC-like DNA-binding protein